MATVIHVPGDRPTIQAGIDSSSTGDTVMVAPGTYSGTGNCDISTLGKAITVMSEEGPFATIIDGGITDNGFNISTSENSSTVIQGFTIKRANRAIYCDSSAVSLRNLIIKDFLVYGIYIDGYTVDPPVAPVVENCLVFQEQPAYQGTGIGMRVTRSVDITIRGSLFSDCTYEMEYHSQDNMVPNFDIQKCIIKNSVIDGIWTHS